MYSRNPLRRLWSSGGIRLAGLLLAGVAGCGSEPYKTLPVSGKVTCENGPLARAARIKILFTPQVDPIDAKTHPRPAFGLVNVNDGTFGSGECQVTTIHFGDGAIVGPQKVKIFGVFFDDKGGEQELELEVNPSEVEVGPESTEFEFRIKLP